MWWIMRKDPGLQNGSLHDWLLLFSMAKTLKYNEHHIDAGASVYLCDIAKDSRYESEEVVN